jgi:Uma2 family endonuclease
MEKSNLSHYVEPMEPAYKLLTVEEFLDSCPNDRRHYQLFGGVVVAMAPPGDAHQVVTGNLMFEIGSAVRANLPNCSVRSQAGIAPQGVRGRDHFETDITVTCEPFSRGYRGIIQMPLLIIEVLSPSTERDDAFIKLPAYQRIPSLREILYVETESVGATVYRRGETGWQTIELNGADARVNLETVGLDIGLSSLYRGIP